MSASGERIAAMLEDEYFVAVLEDYKAHLTGVICSEQTTQEVREKTLGKLHGLTGLQSSLLSESQNITKEL